MSDALQRRNETPSGSDYVAGGRPLNGSMTLAIFVGLFIVVLVANGLMTYLAIKTFSGEVVAHPYERGLAYNREIAAARAQERRDWKVDVRLSPAPAGASQLVVVLHDAAGAAIDGLDIEALLLAPADLKQDMRIKLEDKGDGRYAGQALFVAGRRDLVLSAKRSGQEVFRSQNRLDAR